MHRHLQSFPTRRSSDLNILRLVVGEGARMAVFGVVLGIAASFLITRLMSSLLFGISATDRKSTRLNSQSPDHLVCRLLLEKKKSATKPLARQHEVETPS